MKVKRWRKMTNNREELAYVVNEVSVRRGWQSEVR
jgi:hypothetical protein